MTVTVRFAPSPTGRIHIGNARTAILNWLFARKAGGRFILRFDDTDLERSTLEFADGIATDLDWLGLTPDEVYRQSERFALYDDAAEKLKSDGRLYACLYAHEEKVSEACDEATTDVANQLDLLFELVGYAKFQCRADIKKHCSGVEMGGGQILSCLQGKSGLLTGDCAKVVNRLRVEN